MTKSRTDTLHATKLYYKQYCTQLPLRNKSATHVHSCMAIVLQAEMCRLSKSTAQAHAKLVIANLHQSLPLHIATPLSGLCNSCGIALASTPPACSVCEDRRRANPLHVAHSSAHGFQPWIVAISSPMSRARPHFARWCQTSGASRIIHASSMIRSRLASHRAIPRRLAVCCGHDSRRGRWSPRAAWTGSE